MYRKSLCTDTGKQRYACKVCGHRTVNPATEPQPPQFTDTLPSAQRYVVTAAQNATGIHDPFFRNLLAYCRKFNAQLVVIPLRYKNPTSTWTAELESHNWWHSDLVPYLYDGRLEITPRLKILADIKTQPTAVRPLSGLQSVSGGSSAIIGHTKVELETVPTPQHSLPKIMTTTGAVTVANYTDTKAGRKGEFHHTLGATVVEVGENKHHIRQIIACEDGSFIDLDCSVANGKTKKAPPAAALIMGDTHVKFACPKVESATFSQSGIVEALQPEALVWHDLLDQYARNHHHRGDPFIAYAKMDMGVGSVESEVYDAAEYVNSHGKGRKNIIVGSNHNDALGRWIKESDWRGDPLNAQFYLETAAYMVRNTKMDTSGAVVPDPFAYWMHKWVAVENVILGRTEPYTVHGIALQNHGDKGANGARGSRQVFSRVGVKSVIGHSHSPGIMDGCYQTGTSTRLTLEYNSGGLSSWLNTHCVIYANGKRSLINIIDGEWRL